MGEALETFVEEASTVNTHFDPHTVFTIGPWEVTQYIVWLFIAVMSFILIMIVYGRFFRFYIYGTCAYPSVHLRR